MNKNEIWLSEIFKSIQGEGPETGTTTVFVRVFACNMNPPCPWCDSMYAVQKIDDTVEKVPVESVVNKILELDCLDVTFTGGEPLLYQEQMYSIMKLLSLKDNFKFHFETNGLIVPPYEWTEEFDITYGVSPKLHAMNLKEGMHPNRDCNEYIAKLRKWVTTRSEHMFLKFVYESPETINQLSWLKPMLMSSLSKDSANGIKADKIDIYLMPEGNEFNQDKYVECADQCIKHGYKMTPRLHNIIWGPKRGV